MLDDVEAMTADQFEVISELERVQQRITTRDAAQTSDLSFRTRLVERGRELGLSQAFIAERIKVRPNVLGQAALRERRRSTAA